jgi:hypothetical protein
MSIAAAVLLSPVLAFFVAIAVEIVLGIVKDTGMLEFLAIVASGVVGWLLLGKLRVRPRGRASVGT